MSAPTARDRARTSGAGASRSGVPRTDVPRSGAPRSGVRPVLAAQPRVSASAGMPARPPGQVRRAPGAPIPTPDPGTAVVQSGRPVRPAPVVVPVRQPWLRAQGLNVTRHAAALRPFRAGEFGSGAAAPTAGHLQAVNALLRQLRGELLRQSEQVRELARAAQARPVTGRLQRLLTAKEQAHDWVREVERIWDFYFELFGQRQTVFADALLSCDRIALSCYQAAYLGVGEAKPLPAPPPFSFMRTGFSPATFRRGIPLRRLGRRLNPFPLVQLPYHRLVNPWTLGAVLHEVSHNLQSDLGLDQAVPRAIARRLLDEGCPPAVVRTWVRWNREIYADLCALLLGGPAVVGSLLDVIGRAPATVLTYSPHGPHPTPWLRAWISIELLRRTGFEEQAERYGRLWAAIYPDPRAGTLPRDLLATFQAAHPAVVDALCFRPFPELGRRTLAQVLPFGAKEYAMQREAAERLAAGTDPGIIPARFLIGATRSALDRRLARPGVITRNFYTELARR
ncbi:hypothetical protein [Streptomyces sp. NPDC005799]|uniref:hypothetical protein n=1 Tax=Streptomyces sp. NPDC005799 TaxID=3154678 RepID=UPI0033D60C62